MNLRQTLIAALFISLPCFAANTPAATDNQPQTAFTHGVNMLGDGGETCAEYNAHKSKSFSHVMEMHWIAGFISAYSLIHDIQYTSMSADDFYNRFDQYCNRADYQNTQLSNVAHAMMYDLDKELGVPADFGNEFKEMNKEEQQISQPKK